jgi:hypothetical protein
MMGLFRLPALFFGAFGATAWITQLDQMFLTDGKGYFDLLPQKLPFHFTFQHQLWCIALHHKGGHWTTITQLAPPGPLIVRICCQQPTLFAIPAPVVVAIKVAAINRTLGHLLLPINKVV